MLDYTQKRKLKSVAYHRLTLGALAILVLFLAHSTWRVYTRKKLSEEAKNVSLHQLDELSSRAELIGAKIEALSTEYGVEEEIRSKFSVAKPGEHLVVVVDTPDTAQARATSSPSFWQRLREFFR